MAIHKFDVTSEHVQKILLRTESHFCDFKSKDIQPAKLTKTISALANADGGDVFVGVSESGNRLLWAGFENEEAANAHIQVIEQFFPIGNNFRLSFLHHHRMNGFVLFLEVEKTPDVKKASDGIAYLRRGAQSLPQTTADQINRLSLNKGIHSFEDHLVNNGIEFISQSVAITQFMSDVVPVSTSSDWLKKQKLVVDGKPSVAGAMLFSDEPQIEIPKGAIKIYRYKTNEMAGTRETLDFDPVSVEGNAYNMIYSSVEKIRGIIEGIPIADAGVLSKLEYPTEAIHEIITNAVIHRDYSINDDIHVRIFDNRIEVQSPGLWRGT